MKTMIERKDKIEKILMRAYYRRKKLNKNTINAIMLELSEACLFNTNAVSRIYIAARKAK